MACRRARGLSCPGDLCPEDGKFEEFWLGLLTDQEASAVLDQLRECSECRTRLALARRRINSMKKALETPPKQSSKSRGT